MIIYMDTQDEQDFLLLDNYEVKRFDTDDCMDAGGRTTQDTKVEITETTVL